MYIKYVIHFAKLFQTKVLGICCNESPQDFEIDKLSLNLFST